MNLDAVFYVHAKILQMPLQSLKRKCGEEVELSVIEELHSLLWPWVFTVEKSFQFHAAGIYKGQRVFKIELLGVT